MSQGETIPDHVTPADAVSAADLLPSVYRELRDLAAARLSKESDTQTLQPTALVHEAWLRVANPSGLSWDNRAQFFAAAAEAMRRILVDRARTKQSQKRDALVIRMNVDQLNLATSTDGAALLRLDEALDELAVLDPECCQLIKLRFFVGLDYEEAAKTMGISERSAKRYWTFGRAWLYRKLNA
jgi:RNA polymerase sigma factor (TIGR02999 family)